MSLYDEAKKCIPGGVNSPVRAFGSVNAEPVFAKTGDGAYIYDEDGNKYMDFINSWGPLILGHNPKEFTKKTQTYIHEGLTFGLPTKYEVEMAKIVTKAIDTDMVRMVNSGTEATMSVIRLARGYTGKNKLLKFEGCYHGHSDSLLVKSGSGALTYNMATSKGVTKGTIEDTLVCPYNDIEALKKIIESYPDQIACCIVEPVAGNMGVVAPDLEFFKELRRLTKENNILLIFDEVITGFRIRYGSVDKYLGVKPDLYCFGKIIGGGLPVGAFAGPKEIMDELSPNGGVYQAGTLSGNPLAMKMGRDILNYLKEHSEIYDKLENYSQIIEQELNKTFKELQIKATVSRYKSMFSIFFGMDTHPRNYDDVQKADTKQYEKFFKGMLKNNIIIAPSQFEGMFLSNAHTKEDIEEFLNIAKKVLKEM